MNTNTADVVVVGAGIVGAACAFSFARHGLKTLVLDASFPGSAATAAGMGHIVVMDDSDAQRFLTLRSRELWTELIDEMPADCEYDRRGTLWMAADDEEMQIVQAKADAYAALGMPTETLDTKALHKAEPRLHPELAGGLRVPDDFVIYPPTATRWLLGRAVDFGAEVITNTPVHAISAENEISLSRNETISAKSIVLATGTSVCQFFPHLPVRPRKGHLLITERRPGFLHHQVIELGYLKSTHGLQKDSVACNVQPRPTGQLLVGSSRQTEDDELPVRPQLVSRMLDRATRYIPELPQVQAIRTWTGFRAATPDKLPIIGPIPDQPNLLLATGHEGLGIATSMASERLAVVLIVGAGPAGIAAATTAAQSGANTTVLDMNIRAGGQIWRRDASAALPKQAQRWIKRFSSTSVECIPQAKVIALGERGEIIVERPGETLSFRCDKLILATGARELFLPFPGWTTPNIMGAGGLQVMVKNGLPIAGKRVAIAGSGPLLLAVAASLRQKGADVRLIAEQAPAMSLAGFALRLPSLAPSKILQAIGLKTKLLGIPYRTSCWPVSTEGTDRLSAVTFQQGKKQWKEEVDYLACGFGLVPNVELPVLCGCQLDGRFVKVDRWQQTTVENVYCIGESTGIGGVEKSLIEGRIAGFAATGNTQAAKRLFRKRRRTLRFATALDQAFTLRDELKELANDDTFVCRCEDVSYEQVKRYAHAREAKVMTRCGMGHCQGRICGDAGRFLFDWEGQSIRPPILPTPMENLVDQGSA